MCFVEIKVFPICEMEVMQQDDFFMRRVVVVIPNISYHMQIMGSVST